MTKRDLEFIKESLEAAKAELEELCRTEHWFVSDSLELIESALEILQKELLGSKAPKDQHRSADGNVNKKS